MITSLPSLELRKHDISCNNDSAGAKMLCWYFHTINESNVFLRERRCNYLWKVLINLTTYLKNTKLKKSIYIVNKKKVSPSLFAVTFT